MKNSNGMKNIKTKIYYLITLVLLPYISYAGNPIGIVTIQNPLRTSGSLMELIVSILNNIVMPIAAVLVVLFIIYSGFMFLMAQGKPKEIEDAKKNLLWSLIGAGILLGAVAISRVVEITIRNLTN